MKSETSLERQEKLQKLLQKKQELRRHNRRIKILLIASKSLVYLCLLPALYTCSCIGRDKRSPVIGLAGSVGVVAGLIGVGILSKEEHRIHQEAYRIHKELSRT